MDSFSAGYFVFTGKLIFVLVVQFRGSVSSAGNKMGR
jgi:hypothetical protein